MEDVPLSTLVNGKKTLMGQCCIVKGYAIPHCSDPQEQTGFVISGKRRFKVEDVILEMEGGDNGCLPGAIKHSVVAQEASAVIKVFGAVREVIQIKILWVRIFISRDRCLAIPKNSRLRAVQALNPLVKTPFLS